MKAFLVLVVLLAGCDAEACRRSQLDYTEQCQESCIKAGSKMVEYKENGCGRNCTCTHDSP